MGVEEVQAGVLPFLVFALYRFPRNWLPAALSGQVNSGKRAILGWQQPAWLLPVPCQWLMLSGCYVLQKVPQWLLRPGDAQ